MLLLKFSHNQPPIKVLSQPTSCQSSVKIDGNEKLGSVYRGHRCLEFLYKKLYNKDGWKNI